MGFVGRPEEGPSGGSPRAFEYAHATFFESNGHVTVPYVSKSEQIFSATVICNASIVRVVDPHVRGAHIV